jgi:hypothetical protein
MTTDPTRTSAPPNHCLWCGKLHGEDEPGIGRARHEQECRARVFSALWGYAAMTRAPSTVQKWINSELERAREWGD